MCDADDRLGANGVDEIKAHPFFRNLDWANLRQQESRYKPENMGEDDCARFDRFEEEEPWFPAEDAAKRSRKQRKDINFVGYTYKADVEEQKSKLVQALQETLNTDFAEVAQEEGPRPMQTNDPTPKNKSNFYYAGAAATETTPQRRATGGAQQH